MFSFILWWQIYDIVWVSVLFGRGRTWGLEGTFSVPICEVGLYTTRYLYQILLGDGHTTIGSCITANICSSLWWDDHSAFENLWNMVAHGAPFHPLGSHLLMAISWAEIRYFQVPHPYDAMEEPPYLTWMGLLRRNRRTAVNPFDGEPRRSFFGGPTVTQAYFNYLKRVRQTHIRSKIELGTRRWQICARSTLEHWHGTCYQFNFLMFECSCCSICVWALRRPLRANQIQSV